MGKNKKKRRRQEAHASSAPQSALAHSSKSARVGVGEEGESDDDELSQFEIDMCVRTLNICMQRDLLHTKAFKPLRQALDPLVKQQMSKYEPTDYTAQVTRALATKQWRHALLGLNGVCKCACVRTVSRLVGLLLCVSRLRADG